MAAPAAAAAIALPPLARWDHLLPAARLAGEQTRAIVGSDQFFSKYVAAFNAVIHAALPNLTIDEQMRMHADAHCACCLRMFDMGGDRIAAIDRLYAPVASDFQFSGSARRSLIVFRLRRIHRHPTGWAAFVKKLAAVQGGVEASRARPYTNWDGADDRRAAAKIADAIAALARETFRPEIERTRFDASQVERHMAIERRVPADVSNLIGQFATAGITTQAPIPLRLQTKHKLELLTRRITSLTPAQTAAELRSILGEVEEALPDDERTLKKARK